MTDTPYIDADGYKAPGCFILSPIELALREMQRALEIAYQAIPEDEQWYYQLSQKKGEQDWDQMWQTPDDPQIQRFKQVQTARNAVLAIFRSLASEGKPYNLKLAKHRRSDCDYIE